MLVILFYTILISNYMTSKKRELHLNNWREYFERLKISAHLILREVNQS